MQIQSAFNGYSSDDIDACRTFYADVLGVSVRDDMGGLGLDIEGQQVFIYPKDDHEPATFTVLNIVVSDIEDAIEYLSRRGVSFERYDDLPVDQDGRGIMRGKEVGTGPNIAWCKDPSDNVIAIVEE